MSLEVFSVRLRELMKEEKMSRHALALRTQSERKSISYWLAGKFYPRYDTLIKVADCFDVSINYLVGLSDKMTGNYIKNFDPTKCHDILVKHVSDYINKNGYTIYRMVKCLGIGQTTFMRWYKGNAMPETASLIKVAQVLDETVDYLLGRES